MTRSQELLRDRTVRDVPRVIAMLDARGLEAWTIDESATVFEATRKMVQHRTGSLLVLRGGQTVGLVTERDYLTKVLHQGRTSKETPVGDIATMEHRLVVASLDDTLQDCVDVMARRGFRHLPVAEEGGKVVGLLSLQDIVQVLAEERKQVLSAQALAAASGMPIHDG